MDQNTLVENTSENLTVELQHSTKGRVLNFCQGSTTFSFPRGPDPDIYSNKLWKYLIRNVQSLLFHVVVLKIGFIIHIEMFEKYFPWILETLKN